MINTLSIDWLQLYCRSNSLIKSAEYTFVLMPYQSKSFRVMYDVIYKNELLCSVQCTPTSSIIPAETHIVKFANRQLYGENLTILVHDFLRSCNLDFRAITRIDLALDFNNFVASLYPETFIKRFLSNYFLKNGRGKFTLIGEQKFENSYQYLRFGERGANVNVYLYNKSVELAQVHDKPYIRQRWQEAGIDITKPVWRLEISIKSTGTHYLELETGELKRINIDFLHNLTYLYDIFYSYAAQYFSFKINDGLKNKTRMKPAILLNSDSKIYKPLYLPDTTGAAVSDKIFAKKLYLLDQELRGLDDSTKNSIKHVMSEFLELTDLNEYVNKRKDFWNRTHFKE